MKHRLSTKQGGIVEGIKSYCSAFHSKPPRVWNRMLCTGGGVSAPCLDLAICSVGEEMPVAEDNTLGKWLDEHRVIEAVLISVGEETTCFEVEGERVHLTNLVIDNFDYDEEQIGEVVVLSVPEWVADALGWD